MRVIKWDSNEGEPFVEMAIDGDPRWQGYVFRLSYESGELVGLVVRRGREAARLGAQLLQRVPLGALDRYARSHVGEFLTDWKQVRNFYSDSEAWIDLVTDPDGPRDDDLRLARLCQRYLALNQRQGWRQTLAREFHYKPSSIQTIIGRARARQFLTPVPRGQWGGQLMPKALRLLGLPGGGETKSTAWGRATSEQRSAALQRESRVEELDAALASGSIDVDSYTKHLDAIMEED